MSVDAAEAAMSRGGTHRLEVAFLAAVEADYPRFLHNLLRLQRDGVGGVRRRGRLGAGHGGGGGGGVGSTLVVAAA
jgi:hypothetical protein